MDNKHIKEQIAQKTSEATKDDSTLNDSSKTTR